MEFAQHRSLRAAGGHLQVSHPDVQAEKSNNIAHLALDFRHVRSVHAGPTKEPKPWIEPQLIMSRKLFLRIFIASFRRPPASPRRLGATHFLMKRLPNVATEMALNVLAYNLTRVMNIVGIKPLLVAIRA
jgi:hypothetical protein